MNLRPTDYESVALPLSYTGNPAKLASGFLEPALTLRMGTRPRSMANGDNATAPELDPAMKAKLLQEMRTPWRSLRRALWFALLASAGLGLATMAMRSAAGEGVPSTDWLIQVGALVVCGSLLWLDRNRNSET